MLIGSKSMLKLSGTLIAHSFRRLFPLSSIISHSSPIPIPRSPIFSLKFDAEGAFAAAQCSAQQRVVYDDGDGDDEEYGQNKEIAILEAYTLLVKDEVLLVKAMVDGDEAEVLVYKGFSSCLSYKTSADPSTSVIPARAVVTSIDRVRGPFDPSNIQYIEKGLTFEAFKKSLLSSN